MHVRIHHADYGILICQDPDDHRELTESEMLRRVLSAVAGDDLIHSFRKRADDQRGQNPVPADAVDQVFHLLVILHLEWVAAEWTQALYLDLHYPLVVIDTVDISRHTHAPSFRWWRSGVGEQGSFCGGWAFPQA